MNIELKTVLGRHFEDMYYRVLREVNKILQRAKLQRTETLLEEDAEYTEMASELQQISGVLKDLSVIVDAEYESQKLEEYVAQVVQLASAIENNDQVSLDDAINILDRRPFL